MHRAIIIQNQEEYNPNTQQVSEEIYRLVEEENERQALEHRILEGYLKSLSEKKKEEDDNKKKKKYRICLVRL